MNRFLSMVPLFFIRFGLLRMVNQTAVSRAAYFAPLEGGERTAYLFYQLSNTFLVLYPLFTKVRTTVPQFYIGLGIYGLGIVILIVSTVHFATPDQNGFNQNGIYRWSRNPMYVGYFFYYLGCCVLTSSLAMTVALIVFQIASHWIILSEERWCKKKLGEEYVVYMSRVRRYL